MKRIFFYVEKVIFMQRRLPDKPRLPDLNIFKLVPVKSALNGDEKFCFIKPYRCGREEKSCPVYPSEFKGRKNRNVSKVSSQGGIVARHSHEKDFFQAEKVFFM